MRPLPPLPLMFDEKLAPNGALLFDNSTLENLKCPKLLEFKWLRRRELVANKAGRNFGSGMHAGWAVRYERCGANAPKTEDIMAINDAMAEWFAKSPPPEGDFRNFDHACRMMNAYIQNYPVEPFRIVNNPRTGKPLVEASFCLPFDFEIQGHPVYYTGKIDTGIEDNTGIWSFDHKTAFQFGDTFNAQMNMDGGQMGYFWALWKTLGVRPAGYVIDAVRVRKPTKRNEYTEKGGAPVDATDFMRIPVAVPFDDAVEAWREDVKQLIRDIVNYHNIGHFPRHRWNCVNKFGKCDFYEVCSCPLAQQDAILYESTLFEKSTWSPLNPVNKTPNEQ